MLLKWIRTHSFTAHTIAFVLLMVSPIPMFLAAREGSLGWIAGLLSLVILGNLIELSLK